MARLCWPPEEKRATTASIMPIAAVPFPGTPAPGMWLIAMSDGGATIIIQHKSTLRCMIKGLNLVLHEDNAPVIARRRMRGAGRSECQAEASRETEGFARAFDCDPPRAAAGDRGRGPHWLRHSRAAFGRRNGNNSCLSADGRQAVDARHQGRNV